MREAWRSLLFADEQLRERAQTRDPVAAADSAKRKKATRQAADRTTLHSFRTLLADLAQITRNVCRTQEPAGERRAEFELDTQMNAGQARAKELLKAIQSGQS